MQNLYKIHLYKKHAKISFNIPVTTMNGRSNSPTLNSNCQLDLWNPNLNNELRQFILINVWSVLPLSAITVNDL